MTSFGPFFRRSFSFFRPFFPIFGFRPVFHSIPGSLFSRKNGLKVAILGGGGLSCRQSTLFWAPQSRTRCRPDVGRIPGNTEIGSWMPCRVFGQDPLPEDIQFVRVHSILEFREFMANSNDFPWKNPTEIHHDFCVSAVCANYDGFLWVSPRKVVRTRRLNSHDFPKFPIQCTR